MRHATLAYASEKKNLIHSLSRYLANELLCFHLETLKRLYISEMDHVIMDHVIISGEVLLKWFIITNVVQATLRTRPFSVENRVGPPSPRRRKTLETRLLRTLLLNASEYKTQSIHNVRNWSEKSEHFLLLHDTQVSKVALCSVRLNEVDNKEFNSN